MKSLDTNKSKQYIDRRTLTTHNKFPLFLHTPPTKRYINDNTRINTTKQTTHHKQANKQMQNIDIYTNCARRITHDIDINHEHIQNNTHNTHLDATHN